MGTAAAGIDRGSLFSKSAQVIRGVFDRPMSGAACVPEIFHHFPASCSFFSLISVL
jgi:hypothetical protein